MSLLRSILVPHDFSPESRAAFALADELAGMANARIHLLHVVNAPALLALPPAGPFDVATPEATSPGAVAAAEDTLRAIACCAHHDVEVHVSEGLPTDTICHVADEVHADLIVMGTHARASFSHLLLGSVAERTLRRAPCPVLTVRAPSGEAKAS